VVHLDFLLGVGLGCSCSTHYLDISCSAGYWKAGVEEIKGQKSGLPWISKLILGYLFLTTVFALTGMEYWARDLATCKQVLSSLVNARNASFA
jgi:hypothetical protein